MIKCDSFSFSTKKKKDLNGPKYLKISQLYLFSGKNTFCFASSLAVLGSVPTEDFICLPQRKNLNVN